MSKILFINGNIHGHINPTLPVVQELVRQGEEVSYISTKEFKQKIENTGAHFIDYGNKLTDFLSTYRPKGNHPFYSLIEFILAMDRATISIIKDMIEDKYFDLIIHDAMLGGGNIIAKQLDIPAVSTCSSFAMDKVPVPTRMMEPGCHPQLNAFYHNLKEAEAEWKIGSITMEDIFFKKENLNLVFTSKLFQPASDNFDETFCFVGPSIASRNDVSSDLSDYTKKTKLIYISMGTINNQCQNFYQQCIEAFREEDYQVIMSIGTKTDIQNFQSIPQNFIIKNYVSQLDVLQNADLFISHGGLNSVSEALYYSVPIIAIPLANDQFTVAHQLVKLQAGLELKSEELTSKILRESAHMVLNNQNFKSHCQKIRESFLQAGGYRTAARYILDYIKSQK